MSDHKISDRSVSAPATAGAPAAPKPPRKPADKGGSLLSVGARKRLIALHGWAALVISAVLYIVLVIGALAVFDNEILHWSQGATKERSAFEQKITPMITHITEQVPEALRKEVTVSPGDNGTLLLRYSGSVPDRTGRMQSMARLYVLDPQSDAVLAARAGRLQDVGVEPPDHALEHFLVDLHIRLHVPGRLGLYLTGITGIAMLIAVISGILIHRNILREMFLTERPGKRLVSFRDRHNLVGVWSPPFAIVLAFTGAFLSFATSLGLPIVALSAFGGDMEKALSTVFARGAAR